MAIDEAARHHLHETLDTTLGRDDAVTLMEHLPPAGWADVATTTDVDNAELRLDARIAILEQRMDAPFAAVKAELANLDLRLNAAATRSDLAGVKLRLVERMRRHDQILIATLLPLTLCLVGLLATAILRAPSP